ENSLHKVFKGNQLNKMNNRKEFFNVTLKEIKSAIDRMNINAHWTIFAEAKEYRESLALEREKASSSENEQDKLNSFS
ncbi:GIY-YIG nuclease family protein, partial [Dickeya chrysanthemi]|uniref:GIY-YIG nuclease family protein n=1 Tax=Dickeya chrysanthemi TaxID=556 RepID=UPI003016CC05